MLKLIALGMFVIGAQLTTLSQTAIQTKPANDVKSLVGNQNYDKLVLRLKALNRDIESKGLHVFPGASGKMLTGYAYGEYYDWDLYFENIYLSYYGESKYNFTNLKVFLDRQQPDGFISRTVGITYPRPRQMFKPFLAQIAVLGSKQNGDSYEWLRDRYYERLQKYLQRWFAYDTDKNGLPVWNSSDASGMDNQISRSGDLDTYQDEGVDLACELYRELQAMEVISVKLGKADEATMYAAHAAKLAKDINAVFWDEKDGFYYDRDQKTGKQIRVKSIAGFFPLWAGVASPKQAERLVHEHLLNANEFWLKYPVATYAKTEPDFYEGSKTGECNWQGPAWIPINFIIFHGLLQYGYDSVAHDLAIKTLDMALNENAATREYYNSDTGKGNGMNPFWGWSSLAYVMPIDLAEHYDPMDLHGAVRPLISDELGVNFK
ncbi:MAG: trehalase family glycosidase [Terracidiphilus sp.]|nr:trehalase family glycosidase [Terracidiphilus sp.]MDR3775855.1 trehalase family glycosidase [Terracidiphilus sp.]